MRLSLILFLLFFFVSCAKTPAEEVDEAIDLAMDYIDADKCDEAIDVLEDVGRDQTNADYLQVLASAYACRAGYNEITFITDDIPLIDSDAADLMKSLTQLSLSDESEADSDEYDDLKEALDILLNVDSNQPSQTAREATYGTRKAGDMGVQALFLSMVQLGKFLHFYGNVSAMGVKGGGTASVDEQTANPSECFVTYTYAPAKTFLTAAAGTCNNMASDNGHPNLSFAVADLTATKRRMCEGLMLITNILDILENMTLPADSSYGQLSTVSTTVSTFKSAVITADPNLETLIETTSQSECETLVADSTEFDNLQYIYAILFEGGLP